MKKQQSEEVRATVSKAYAKAVTSPSNGGCCSDSTPAQKGRVVKLAGYSREALEALPPEAVVNSFGCGNPLAFSEVKEGDAVLDLGSGAGIDLLIAAKKVGPTGRAIGIDMTDEMIAKARENIAVSGLTNAEVRKGIIENLPMKSSSVDWLVSNCVINLSPDKHKVFAEIARRAETGWPDVSLRISSWRICPTGCVRTRLFTRRAWLAPLARKNTSTGSKPRGLRMSEYVNGWSMIHRNSNV